MFNILKNCQIVSQSGNSKIFELISFFYKKRQNSKDSKKKKSPQMPVTVVLKVGPPNQKYLYHLRICQKNADLRGHTRFLHLCFSKPPRCLRMLILEFVNHWSKTELGDEITNPKIQVGGYKLLKAPDCVILAITCEEGETRKWFSSHRLPWEPWWPTLRTTAKTWKKFKVSNFHVSARGSHGRCRKSPGFLNIFNW